VTSKQSVALAPAAMVHDAVLASQVQQFDGQGLFSPPITPAVATEEQRQKFSSFLIL